MGLEYKQASEPRGRRSVLGAPGEVEATLMCCPRAIKPEINSKDQQGSGISIKPIIMIPSGCDVTEIENSNWKHPGDTAVRSNPRGDGATGEFSTLYWNLTAQHI